MFANRTFTAEFPTVAYAKSFEARLNEGRDWVKNVARKGRTVTFEGNVPDDVNEAPSTIFGSWLELVGYYGSTMNRKAKLDGVPAPFAW